MSGPPSRHASQLSGIVVLAHIRLATRSLPNRIAVSAIAPVWVIASTRDDNGHAD
jgi:hypothetical protein